MWWILFGFLLLVTGIHCQSCNCQEKPNQQTILKALNIIQELTPSNCQAGAGSSLDTVPNYSLFESTTRTPILVSNFWTVLLQRNKCSPDQFPDEFYFNVVKNNIGRQSGIFASIIALKEGIHPKHPLFAPYAFQTNNYIKAFDLSTGYNYTEPENEWYQSVATKNYSDITTLTTKTQFNRTGDEVEETLLTVLRKDGVWSKVYYDCAGGNIWMITYSSPILCLNSETKQPEFSGVATIDIDVSRLDINQCSYNDDNDATIDTFCDVFRGTDNCQPTTQCKFKPGFGLKRGGYICVCSDGYVMQNQTMSSFSGEDIEKAISNSEDLGRFKCILDKKKNKEKNLKMDKEENSKMKNEKISEMNKEKISEMNKEKISEMNKEKISEMNKEKISEMNIDWNDDS